MFSSNTTQVSGGAYEISRSLRFNAADQAYLVRAPSTTTNRRTFTWSAWIKRSEITPYQSIFSANDNTFGIAFGGDQQFQVFFDVGAYAVNASNLCRDPSAWYHLVVAVDTTQATAANRVKMYINGTQITSFASATYPPQNFDTAVNQASSNHRIGAGPTYAGNFFGGYQTEVYIIDGQQLTPSSFGATDIQTGVWSPTAFTGGAYGTNGFYVNFSDNSNTTATTLGKDYSGNGNNFTPTNLSVTAGINNDSYVDVPTSYGLIDTGVGGTVRGNYATLNYLNAGNPAFLNNGNLAITNPSDSNWRTGVSTIGVSSGKWYAEVTVTNNNLIIGLDKASVVFAGTTTFMGGSPTGWGLLATGQTYNNSSVQFNNPSYIAGDVIGLGLDADTGVLTFYKNGVAASGTVTGLTSGPYVLGFSANSSGNGSINYGQRPFAYTAPSGFKALCTQNLPTPTIGATTATQASQYFAPVLYTGNGSTQSVTVGFQPDWVWLKNRGSVGDNGLFDVLRGTTNRLVSNSTNAADTISGVTAFNSSGFSLGADYNASANSFVSWNWRASNTTAVSNTAGTITSQVSASTASGFSVITYSGSAVAATIGHGLGVAPSMIISKRTGSGNWAVYHISLGINQYVFLNSDAAANTVSNYWGTTSPTSTVFGVIGGGYDNNSGPAVAYCFAPIAGYSAFGSYTANGSADGPFVYTGFRPAWILFKGAGGGTNWFLFDSKRSTYNSVGNLLYPNAPNAENTGATYLDFLSNGFKIRTASGDMNSSGTYTYAAFAENPFKYSLAR